MSRLQKEILQAFSNQGLLAKGVPGYRPRQVQVDLASAVANALEQQRQLVAEAGTGIGKTFAYLVPALLSGKKTLISTGSKALQDQLFFKDLPRLLNLLELPPKVALLKGRANYFCHHHFGRQLADLPKDPKLVDELMRIRHWANGTPSGDFAELTGIADDALSLRLSSSSNDNCLGKRCGDYDRCFLRKARERAMEADVTVINHHLFFADMALKETGFGELLPNARLVVFDEAHQLPDIALTHFADSLGSRGLLNLARVMERAYLGPLRDCRQLQSAAQRLKGSVAQLYDQLEHGANLEGSRLLVQEPVIRGLSLLDQDLDFCQQVLAGQLGRDDDADHAFEQCDLLRYRLSQFSSPTDSSLSLEIRHGHFILRASPLSVADRCRDYFSGFKAGWVFTSATLSVAGRLDHFVSELGLNAPDSLLLDSPFDYANQALLCVPRYLPEPGRVESTDALAKLAKQLIEAADGRTFLLFTSHQAMNQVALVLQGRLHQPVLVQGMGSKRVLLERFGHYGNAVLLGTYSFWEGVDVRGRALCCVMIDKLPFSSPDDPLVKARSDAVIRRGGDPFQAVQLPQAVIALKQGVGRLIRGEQDKGVLVIADPRLVHRPYGGLFLASLPPMARTRELEDALAMLRTL